MSETDPNGNVKRNNYNQNNNLTKFTSALGNIKQYVYDTDNNLIKEIDPRNKTKQYTYDKLHRLTKTTSEMNVITNSPIGEKILAPMPKNFGTEPTNNAKVNNPNAIPLLLSRILLSAVRVIGIVILKNNIAKIPAIGVLKANKNKTEDIESDIIDIFLNPILSPIIPPSIFPNITANIAKTAKIILVFHSNESINPT